MRRALCVSTLLGGFGVLVLASGCTGGTSTENLEEIAVNVVTLQSGTTTDLRERRNQGPFVTYEVSPEGMLLVLETAMKQAGGEASWPYVEVYVSKRYGEVLAKEFGEPGKGYGDPFRSAALAIVHPVVDRPHQSRVETHTIERGPFHRGSVAWRQRLPAWIAAALAQREDVKPIR